MVSPPNASPQTPAAPAEACRGDQAALLHHGLLGIMKLRALQIVWTNTAFAEMVGYAPNELTDQSLDLFCPRQEEHPAWTHTTDDWIGDTGPISPYETRFICKNGDPIWLRATSALLNAEKQESIWAFIDVTDGKRAEELLRVYEKQMAIAQRIGGTGSWTFDIATGKLWGSEGCMRILGYSPVATVLRLDQLEACIAEQDRHRFHQSLQGLIQDSGLMDIDFTIQPADGSALKIVHLLAVLETDAQGQARSVLGFVQDTTQTRRAHEQVRQLAFFDPLTALPNRRLLTDRLGQVLADNKRNGGVAALMFLDLDNFKPLNDLHGHGAGDLLLMEVARRMQTCVRAVDTVSRLGGDEFVVLLVDLPTDRAQAAEQARKIAEKICTTAGQSYLLPVRNGSATIEHHCSVSIGVVLIEPPHQNVAGLLHWADTAMFAAKQEGGNRVTFMIEQRAQPRPYDERTGQETKAPPPHA